MRHLLLNSALAIAAMQSLPARAEERYENPVDKKTYVTSGEFKTYQPRTPRDTRGQRVTTAEVILLTGESELKARVTVQELVGFIKKAEALAYPELAKNKQAMVAMAQFNCQPGKCELKLASQGQAAESTLQAVYDALSRMAPLKASGEVIFQVKFDVGA